MQTFENKRPPPPMEKLAVALLTVTCAYFQFKEKKISPKLNLNIGKTIVI